MRESSPAALSDDRSNSPSAGDSIDDRRKRKVSFNAIYEKNASEIFVKVRSTFYYV